MWETDSHHDEDYFIPTSSKVLAELWEHRGAVQGAEVGPGQICRGHLSWPCRMGGSWGDKEGGGCLWQQNQHVPSKSRASTEAPEEASHLAL